ncbi:hypothetical protein [Alkalihalobacillus pseudalcaliphilus]|uniref:hypothetical protein n=1 Tax=Alkalihalobacillus pseudalcaliphilus TaxID=79884 RepID=UPI00064D82A7|nr:hypothetical protein [Alkalihalobacillus pseudalcaliphilus]KMK75011.1 hypothetical protein AB990_16200 [Alkalihalobacillus pseudalcaliphilus]
MDVIIEKKRSVKTAGDLIATVDERLFALLEDKGERYPYLLLDLQTFEIIQNYDSLPTHEELAEDIEGELSAIYHHDDATIQIT